MCETGWMDVLKKLIRPFLPKGSARPAKMTFGQRPEEGDSELGLKFQWDTGRLQDGRNFFLMKCPLTRQHFRSLAKKEFLQAAMTGRCVLPPYLSATVGHVDESTETFRDFRSFIRGRSPQPECTTLREISANRTDTNAFLESLQEVA